MKLVRNLDLLFEFEDIVKLTSNMNLCRLHKVSGVMYVLNVQTIHTFSNYVMHQVFVGE